MDTSFVKNITENEIYANFDANVEDVVIDKSKGNKT